MLSSFYQFMQGCFKHVVAWSSVYPTITTGLVILIVGLKLHFINNRVPSQRKRTKQREKRTEEEEDRIKKRQKTLTTQDDVSVSELLELENQSTWKKLQELKRGKDPKSLAPESLQAKQTKVKSDEVSNEKKDDKSNGVVKSEKPKLVKVADKSEKVTKLPKEVSDADLILAVEGTSQEGAQRLFWLFAVTGFMVVVAGYLLSPTAIAPN
eukprot:CAMPEP_0196594764 /NCGR_PEP_ID=MMETSP1081-20130531/79235_1 /TAXON_ID=36882 /ORGANISM="Pyramimonas amylifera, Strain CCMP720" /LENGTH=209 /DNA_ID=CAMNT_0041919117 /DNA_START=345 /DNA_END=974 /DNA_ORIENTATION=-